MTKFEQLFISGFFSGFMGIVLYIFTCLGIWNLYGFDLNAESWAIYVLLIQSCTIWYMMYNLWFTKSWDY